MDSFVRLVLASALSFSVLQLRGEDILLRMDARPDAAIVARVTETDPAVASATAVLDEAGAADGWKWTEYTTSMKGYVPMDDLGKNFDLPSGTYVRSEPSTSGSILTVASDGDDFQYVEAVGNWATYRFTKPVPVYFQTASAPTKVIAASASTATVVAGSSDNGRISVTHGSAPVIEPADPVALEIEQPQVASADAVEAKPSSGPKVMVETQRTSTVSAPRRPAPDAVTSRILTGKLIRESRGYGPNYPIRLLGADGRQLAYVDMSHIFISDLRPYLNETVFVRGEVRQLVPGSKDLIITARTIQLAK